MKQSKNNNTRKIMKIITIPIRALAKVRDFYVNSMNSYADLGCYGGALGISAVEPFPRNFGTNSLRSSAEYDDLIRAASSRAAYAEKVDLEALNQHRRPNFQKPTHPIEHRRTAANARARRSASVGMAKIDEDRACEFGDDDCGEDIPEARRPFCLIS